MAVLGPGRRRQGMKTKVFTDRQPERRDVRDDLHLHLVGREEVDSGGGGNGASAPIEIPTKSPHPLNESCISSLTLGGEGLASGLPDTGGNNGGSPPALAAGDSDGEGDGEADFDRKTHRGGSASLSRGSNRGRVETKEKFKTSRLKKERLNGTGSGTSELKKSRSKSSATKGRVAAWLGGIDPAVPPQEEIIPPSPSVVKDLNSLQDHWSSTSPGITSPDKDTLKPGGATRAITFLPERINRKPSPSSFFRPAGALPLSYSAAVTSTPPSAPAPASGATVASRNIWKNADQIQSTSQPKGKQVLSFPKPPGYKPLGGKLPLFPPSKPPIDPEVTYGRRGASATSLWASGAINNQRHNLQTSVTRTTFHSNTKDKMKEVPKPLFNSVGEAPNSSSLALSKPVKAEKKLFSAAVMTPAPALKNSRTTASGSGPKKMISTPALPVDVLGGKAAGRSTDNVVAVQPATTTSVFRGGKTTPSANLSTSSSGPPAGKLHELTPKRGIGGTKGTGNPAVNGPPGVIIKATSDPAVVSSSHAVPTLSSTASLIIPYDQNLTGQKQRPKVAIVKLPTLPTPGSGVRGSRSRPVSPRPRSPKAPAEDDNNTNSNPSKSAELAFGQARLRDLMKKYQGSSPVEGPKT